MLYTSTFLVFYSRLESFFREKFQIKVKYNDNKWIFMIFGNLYVKFTIDAHHKKLDIISLEMNNKQNANI